MKRWSSDDFLATVFSVATDRVVATVLAITVCLVVFGIVLAVTS